MDTRTVTIGKLIDQMDVIREKRRKLSEQDKELAAQYAEIEITLIQRMDAEGTTKSSGKGATAGITEAVVANVDWDKAWPLIAKNPQLMIRNINQASFREMFGQKGEKYMAKYGFEPYVKRKISLRVNK